MNKDNSMTRPVRASLSEILPGVESASARDLLVRADLGVVNETIIVDVPARDIVFLDLNAV